MGEQSARQVAQGTTGLISTGLGAAAAGGNPAGAAAAFNTDFNNRALHVDERAILERLKKAKSKEEQQRWDDAACAATHCSAALSDSNPLKAEKAESEKRGQAYQAEIQTLLKMGFRPYTEADRQLDALVSHDPRNKAFLSKAEEHQKQQELFACKGNNNCTQTVENKYAQLLTDRAQFHISLLHYSTVRASCQDDKTCIQASLQQMKALNADLKAQGEDKSNGDRIALSANISSAQWALGDIEGMMNSFGMAGIGIRASEAGNAASKAKAIKNLAGAKLNGRLIFENAPYHTSKGNSVKSPAPTNGQQILDKSIQVKPTSPRRVGVNKSTGEYVIFDRTESNIYHGHTRSWNELHPDMQRALIKGNLVRPNGKII